MEIMDIFELSQVSRRILNCLSLARIPVQPISVVNENPEEIFFYDDDSRTEKVFVIHFLQKPQSISGHMKVNNVCIDVCEKDTEERVICCNSNQFGYGLVHLLTHFDRIFFRMEIALGIELSTLSTMREILCYPIFRKCYYMQIRGEEEVLSNEDCDFLLEKIRPRCGITIFNILSPDFDYKKILHFSRLRVPSLGKMPLEDLKVLDSEIANLGNHQFTEADINEFLHHWIEGNNKKLRRLKLDGFKNSPDWDILLKDIVYTDWNPRERERYYKSKYTVEMETIDCENGRDFRNKDGQLATVVYHSEFLDFLVWNDRFPE